MKQFFTLISLRQVEEILYINWPCEYNLVKYGEKAIRNAENHMDNEMVKLIKETKERQS
jgi:hypothetical protein